jgi:hypothetical protein
MSDRDRRGGQDRVAFVCHRCAGSTEASPEIRHALLEDGCIYCGAAVSAAAFDTR